MNPNELAALWAEETEKLTVAISSIPSWTGGETGRREFCARWLCEAGYPELTVDEAGNLICGYQLQEGRDNLVFMAHLDTVFPETADFTVRPQEDRLYGPGIGDNSANVAGLMMLAKLIQLHRPSLRHGIWFVLSTGEEGLGNLRGSRCFTMAQRDRIAAFVALDLYYDRLFTSCVGSVRYRIAVRTPGGHSYLDFGRENALVALSRLVSQIYDGRFDHEGLTYNVGRMEGGRSVNTIAQDAELLFEFRAVSNAVMDRADAQLRKLVREHGSYDRRLVLELLGRRPCGEPVDADKMQQLITAVDEAAAAAKLSALVKTSASTDCNIPLSLGIPAICFGVCEGGGAHTDHEWIRAGSAKNGLALLLGFLMNYEK